VSRASRYQYSTNPRDNPKSLDDVLAIPESDLPRCDIGRLNLVCALGLPGAENLDIDHCIHTIDKWTNRVEFETRRHLYRAKDPRFVDRYGGSRAKLSAEMLSQVLQEDCGIKYNSKRILDPDFRNPKDLFIHGMINDSNGGTCTSMPVLYTAVARRLRYPVTLVYANGHVFCRWVGKEMRFNIEPTTQGLIFYPDEHYRKWPLPITDIQIERGEYLSSLSPAQELAGFFACRAWCFEGHGLIAEAVKAYEIACRLHPEYRGYRVFLDAMLGRTNPLRIPRRMPIRGMPRAFSATSFPHQVHNVPITAARSLPIKGPPNVFGVSSFPRQINMRLPFNGRHP
jgi:hypothetical protein